MDLKRTPRRYLRRNCRSSGEGPASTVCPVFRITDTRQKRGQIRDGNPGLRNTEISAAQCSGLRPVFGNGISREAPASRFCSVPQPSDIMRKRRGDVYRESGTTELRKFAGPQWGNWASFARIGQISEAFASSSSFPSGVRHQTEAKKIITTDFWNYGTPKFRQPNVGTLGYFFWKWRQKRGLRFGFLLLFSRF